MVSPKSVKCTHSATKRQLEGNLDNMSPDLDIAMLRELHSALLLPPLPRLMR